MSALDGTLGAARQGVCALLLLGPILGLLPAGSTACSGAGGQDVDCDRLEGLERDGCQYTEIQAAGDAAGVIALAPAVQDALVRDAAVMQWVVDHRKDLPLAQGRALCGLLSERERSACSRRLAAPHLSR
ncbi:MAG: hypothetical protein EXR69_08070 [Myxococcales bacterium]|nr:hypothetical protein [Myxococcales bacterium]